MNEDDMIDVFKTCFKYDAVNPYEDIYDSTEEYIISTGKLINSDNNFTDLLIENAIMRPPFLPITYIEQSDLNEKSYKSIFPKRSNTCFSGGIMRICKYSMNLLNGWDERFRGRGWEDYAFTSKIELFLYSTHTYLYSALHLWHPWEINTTRSINENLNSEYEKYNFYDYLKLIEINDEFGSPIKYALLTSIKPYNSLKNKTHVSDYRYYYAKNFFNKLFKKYNNNRNVYLHLCDQLNQLNNNNQIKESGLTLPLL